MDMFQAMNAIQNPHQLLLAKKHEDTEPSLTTAETMDIQATGLKMIGSKK